MKLIAASLIILICSSSFANAEVVVGQKSLTIGFFAATPDLVTSLDELAVEDAEKKCGSEVHRLTDFSRLETLKSNVYTFHVAALFECDADIKF